MNDAKIQLLCSFYDHPSGRKHPNRDCVYGIEGIAPCLPAAMGMGGGIIPYVILPPDRDSQCRKNEQSVEGRQPIPTTHVQRSMLNCTGEGLSPTITASYSKCRGIQNATDHGYPFIMEKYTIVYETDNESEIRQ